MNFQKKNFPLALVIVSFIFYLLSFCSLLDNSTADAGSTLQICLGLAAAIISIIFYFKEDVNSKKVFISLSFLTASLVCGNITNSTEWTFLRVGNIVLFLIPLILFAISFANKKIEQFVGISFIVMCIICTYFAIAASNLIYAGAAALFIAFSIKLFNNKEE